MSTNADGLPRLPGFRLNRLEIRNWGTFDEKIHALDVAGQTALLIGEMAAASRRWWMRC
jgi:uncharacterized protein YPO0396